jgi:hypothetical protein
MKRLFLAFCLFLIPVLSPCAVIFSDNFDAQSDWTLQQYYVPGSDTHCFIPETATCSNPSTQPPTGWSGWYNGLSWCGTSAGSNNIYINAIPGYPIEGSGTCNGGSGKCMTFWDESCTSSFINSDGLLAKQFDDQYQDVYVRFYIKFKSDYTWETTPNDAPQHKLLHLQHVPPAGDDSPFAIGSNDPGGNDPNKVNVPISLSGIHVYGGHVYYYVGFRGERSYYTYSCDVGTDMCFVDLGTWSSVMGDGNWHKMEFRTLTNTNDGSTFNADGRHQFWLDGVLKFDTATHGYGAVTFSGTGSATSPRRGFNYVSIGGNNSNYYAQDGTIAGNEQWYAIDDIVIGTTAGDVDDAPDETAPTVTGVAVSANGTTVTVTFSETVVTTGYDNGDFDLDCSTTGNGIALNSISGSGSTRTFTAASRVVSGETCNLDYTGGADEIEDSAGNDLATFSNTAVTNNSDSVAPDVTFTMPSTASSLTVTFSSFSCSDAVGVTGYCVNQTVSAPTSGSCNGSGWSASAQTAYTFPAEGSQTAYAWCKDAVNISTAGTDDVTISLTTTNLSIITIGTGGTGQLKKAGPQPSIGAYQ